MPNAQPRSSLRQVVTPLMCAALPSTVFPAEVWLASCILRTRLPLVIDMLAALPLLFSLAKLSHYLLTLSHTSFGQGCLHFSASVNILGWVIIFLSEESKNEEVTEGSCIMDV